MGCVGGIEPGRALYVHFGGSIESKRRWCITFPPKLPRVFSLNGDAGAWLQLFGEPGSHDLAKMRRICISGFTQKLGPDTRLIKAETITRLTKQADDETMVEMEREKAWWQHRLSADIAEPFVNAARSSNA